MSHWFHPAAQHTFFNPNIFGSAVHTHPITATHMYIERDTNLLMTLDDRDVSLEDKSRSELAKLCSKRVYLSTQMALAVRVSECLSTLQTNTCRLSYPWFIHLSSHCHSPSITCFSFTPHFWKPTSFRSIIHYIIWILLSGYLTRLTWLCLFHSATFNKRGHTHTHIHSSAGESREGVGIKIEQVSLRMIS